MGKKYTIKVKFKKLKEKKERKKKGCLHLGTSNKIRDPLTKSMPKGKDKTQVEAELATHPSPMI